MQELFQKLGLDVGLLLAQAVNFLLLLVILRAFAYKPILKILRNRKEKIEDGITKAEEADKRLSKANEVMKEKIKEAENESLSILKQTEERAKKKEAELLKEAHMKEEEVLKNAEAIAIAKAQEARERVKDEAVSLVKATLVKTVELDPKTIDEALIKKAVQSIE